MTGILLGQPDSPRANPNVRVSSIDVSGGIQCSRTSGQTPCFVQVSAGAILASGVIVNNAGSTLAQFSLLPFSDLQFEWDFGDPSGTETFTRRGYVSDVGATINANNAQRGPEAAYCYRSAGTYTVTLTVRGRVPSGGYISAKTTQAIVVTAFSASGGTYYFDSVAGSDSNDGLSSGAAKQTLSAMNTIAGTTDRVINVKYGSNYTGTLTLKSRQRLQAYGAASAGKPIFQVTSGATYAITCPSDQDISDIVVSNVDARTSAANEGSYGINFFSAANILQDIYYDNVTATASGSGSACSFQSGDSSSVVGYNCGTWNCRFQTQPTPWLGYNSGCFSFGARYWTFHVGTYVAGAGGLVDGVSAFSHHIYPQTFQHSLYQWITCGDGTGHRFVVNTNWTPPAGAAAALFFPRWHAFVECDFTGNCLGAIDCGTGHLEDVVEYFDLVMQGCLIDGMTNTGVFGDSVGDYTLKDTKFTNIGRHPHIDLRNPSAARMRLYRNYHDDAGGVGTGGTLVEQPASAGTWANPQMITDNTVIDRRTSAEAITFVSSSYLSSGALVDRNRYSVPNDSSNPDTAWTDDTTVKTFAQWQALGFDVNGGVF